MPVKPPRICSCGRKVAGGERCECQRANDRARKARHDENRPTAAARGYDGKWRRERVTYLAANPICRRCGARASIVNHIIPHKGDFSKGGLFWSRRNWEPVCKPCHDGPIQSEEKTK